MADDSSHSLEMDGALDACRDVLRRDLTAEAGLESLREPLRTLSSCARREQMPPERVLVVVKQLLQDVGAYEAMPPQQRDALRGRLIQMVIAAYFGDERRV